MESQIPQWSILLFAMTFIGWVAGFALICGLQYRQVERDVEDELRRGLHREDDPLLREPTLLDEWDAAPRRDRLSTIGLLAVCLLGVTVSWVGSRFDPPWNPLDAGLPLAVSVALWSTTLLLWGLPVYVMAYWQHRWAIRERRWLRSIGGQELLNYLNRNYRPRLSLTEWQTRTRPVGDPRVRYGVILGLGLVGVLMGGGLIYAFVGSFALSVEVGWILAPVWISLVLMLGAMSVVFGHSLARQALVYALLRSDGGGDTSAGPTSASNGSAPAA
ncbi:hypothetical protein FDZ71_12740 [bacterium]|nr:MAG: hypothetical protein FDZ71_12740 [bacterium]